MTLKEIAEYASAQADAAHLRRIEGAELRDDEYWQPVLDIIRAELFIIILRETMTPAETARRFVRDYCHAPSKDAEDNATAALTKLLEQTERK